MNTKNTAACPQCRKKERSDEEKRRLENRLSRIEGQIRGIRTMLEEGVYCPDVLVQVSAVSSALTSFSKELLRNHINTCVCEDIKHGKAGASEELADLLARLMK